MHIRFQGQVPTLGTSSKLGIFQLAFEMRDRFDMPDYATRVVAEHLLWLKLNLKSPKVLDKDENGRAICWFKTSAHDPLAHIWPIKAMLQEFGYHIDVLKTRDPGRIVYEDDWQVAAKPRRRS